jgi:drug/metabolite transporter (DMT)-like permease
MIEPVVGVSGELHTRRAAVGYGMVASAAALFAVNGTVSKVILKSGITAQQLTEVRCAGALLGLVLLAALTRPRSLRVMSRIFHCWSHSASAAWRSCSGRTSTRSPGSTSG